MNEQKLAALEGEEFCYTGKVTGKFNARDFIVPEQLKLKEGAQVIFCKNISRSCVNGTIAKVSSLSEDTITVTLKDGTEVDAYRWDGHYYVGWQRYCADDAIVRIERKPYTMCRNPLCRNNTDCVRFTQRKEDDVADPNIWITDKCDLLISEGSESGYEEKEEDDGRGI